MAAATSGATRFNFASPPIFHLPRSSLPVVTPGEPIAAELGFLRGHGTMVRHDGVLVATVAGVVERVNKLVSVRPMRAVTATTRFWTAWTEREMRCGIIARANPERRR